MTETNKTFSVDDIELFREDESVDFAEVKLYALADGNNSHKNPIKLETLKKYGDSILGKFIIGKYSEIARDTTTHVPSQSILGYVPKDQEVKYEEKDGKTFITVIGLLSKLYATDVVQMFKRDNFRNVSCEFSCNEADEDENGDKEILSFSIHGITILGLRYQPSCAGAEIKVIKFSEKEDEELNPLNKFANIRRKEMAEKKSYKINKTELKEGTWGDEDKTALRNKILEASNKDSLVHSVYLLVEDGWEDAPSEHLKYPVMELSGDTFYYNKNALSSALAYARKEDESEVISKLKKLYKKFKLDFPEEDSKGKEKKMSDEKKEFSAVDLGNLWCRVYDILSEKYPSGNDWGGSIYDIVGIFEEDNKKFAVISKRGEDSLYRLDMNITESGLEFVDEIVKVEQSFAVTDEVRKFSKYFEDMKKKEFEDEKDQKDKESEDEEMSKEDKEDKEKKMSLDANADAGALFAMLSEETKDNEELCKMVAEFSENDTVIMNKFVKHFIEMAKENKDLKEFKEKTEAKETEAMFNKSMADVKGDIEEKEYAKLFEEGKEIKDKEKMKEFAVKVKSFAFDYIKTKTPSSDFRYGNYNTNKPDANLSVWDKISNK